MMARARWVRSSFSLGVNRMSPLTQRLISRVAISVMRICSPRSVMENGADNLNRLLALPDGYRWRGRRNERAVCLFNDGARLPGELFLAGARKPDISADPVLPLSSEVSGDEHLLTTNHQRDTPAGRSKSPCGKIRWIFSVSSFWE